MLEKINKFVDAVDVSDYELDFEDLVLCQSHKERLEHTTFPKPILENSKRILTEKLNQSKLFRETFKEFESIVESCDYEVIPYETGETLPMYDEDDNIVDEFPVTYYKVINKKTKEDMFEVATPTKARAYVFLYDLLDYEPKYFSMYHELNKAHRAEIKRDNLTLPWVKVKLGVDKVPTGVYLISYLDKESNISYVEYGLYLNEGDKIKDDVYTNYLVHKKLTKEEYKDPKKRLLAELELSDERKVIEDSGLYSLDTLGGLSVSEMKCFKQGEEIYLCDIDESPWVNSKYNSILTLMYLNR